MPAPRSHLHLIRMLTERLERISTDLVWAHRASDRMDTAKPHRSPARGLREVVGGSSTDIRARVQSPRGQRVRCANSFIIASNSDMHMAEVRQFCKLDESSESLVRAAMAQLQLSARAYHRILKPARMIADLSGSDAIQQVHIADAL